MFVSGLFQAFLVLLLIFGGVFSAALGIGAGSAR
jgi:hypothetical protein